VQVVNKTGAGTQVGRERWSGRSPTATRSGPSSCLRAPSLPDPNNPANFSRKDFQPVAMYALDTYVLVVKAIARTRR